MSLSITDLTQACVAAANAASAPRAVAHGPWEGSVRRGGDVLMPCLVHANPPPTIT